MDMKNRDGSAHIGRLLIDYHTLLRQHGLSCVHKSSEMVAIQHIIGAILPAKLRYCLESDLVFSHAHIEKTLKKLLKHARKFADAFALVDIGVSHDTDGEATNISGVSNGLQRTRDNGSNGNNGGTFTTN